MKRTIAAVAVSGALLTGGVIAAPPASATVNQYVTFVRSETTTGWTVPRSQIIKLGRTVCNSLDVGVDIYELGEIAVDAGMTTHDAATYVVGAVYFICPRHKGLLGGLGA